MIRVTEPLNFFKEPWYVNWVLKTFAERFKKCADVEKAQKFAMRDLKKISTEATDIGSEVDAIIKENPHGLVLPKKLSVEVNNCLIAYAKWYEVYKPKSITPCTRLNAVIDGVEVSGEPDLMVDDVLVDIKCSKKISLSYWPQVCLYRALRNETGRVAILRLDKETASYEYVVKDYDPSLVAVWLGLARAMVYFKQGEEADGDEL